jgi:NAD(P)-dependent dehydrogenase (short-subunit alcohol dehydrogenase family)
MRPLEGQIAVVAGATRGTGRGIARALGEAGATVYCTGRSTRGNPSPYARPETIDDTADMVTGAGGTGIAVRVDHTVEAEVQALFERVAVEHGRLDVLADAVGGEDPLMGGWTNLIDTDLQHGRHIFTNSILSHLITAKHAAALMRRKRRGVIVQVTEGDMLLGGGNPMVDIVKSSLKNIAVRLAGEVRKDRIAVIAVTPGFLRSERMLEHFGVTEATWRHAGKKDPHFLHSETPLFIGRAVAALAADRKVLEKSGDITSSWDLAREYGFTDADGTRPDWGTHWEEVVMPAMPWLQKATREHATLLDRLSSRAKRYLGEVQPEPAPRAAKVKRERSRPSPQSAG